jgi:chymotrypsin
MAPRVSVVVVALAGLSGSSAARVSKAARSCGAQGARSAGNGTGAQIVNGDDAAECVWKWQVGLRQGSSGLPFCGGTLISEDWIMTAAHCGSRADFNVVAGDWKPRETSGKEQSRRAVQLFRHPSYSRFRQSWDFSLVRVDRPFEMTDCVGTACLPEGDDIAPGSECWISGWGTLSSGGYQPNILQEAKVDTISNQDCHGKFGYTPSQIDDTMLCAQGKSGGAIVDACQGDSGGPLVCESGGVWTLYGATSWGRGCASARFPGVWARVHHVMDWVDSVMANNRGPPPQPQEEPRCPAFAMHEYPDMDGDCSCRHGQQCSTNGGASVDCPSSGGVGAFGGAHFSVDCKDCSCNMI